MCTTCGCGTKHIHMDGDILHHHDYAEKVGDHTHHMHASGINESRRVRIEQAILAKNNHLRNITAIIWLGRVFLW